MKARYIFIIALVTISSAIFAVSYTPYTSSSARTVSMTTPSYSMQSTSSMMQSNSAMYTGTVYAVGAVSPNYSPYRAKLSDPDPDPDPEDYTNEPGTPTGLNQQFPIGDGTWILAFFALSYAIWRGVRGRIIAKKMT